MDGISFATNFGQTLSMGCGDGQCPSIWNTVANLATQAQILNAQSLISSHGWTNASAIDAGIGGTTSSGYLCGVSVCSGDYLNSIQFYFMLPVVSMTSNATMQISNGSSSGSTAAFTTTDSSATNSCSGPGDNAGSLAVAQSTETSTTITVGNSFSTSYSKSVSLGWKISETVGDEELGVSIEEEYSGSVATTATSETSTSTETSNTTTSGSATTVTVNLLCPAGVPANAICTWTYTGYSTTSWNSGAWTLPATYQLLAGNQFNNVIGGCSASGTSNRNNLSLKSLVCNGVKYN